MSLVFTDEQLMVQNTVRTFAQTEVAEKMPELLKNGWSRELYSRVGELGFWRLPIPEEFGGLGKGMVESCMVMEELAKVSPGVALQVEIGINDFAQLLDFPAPRDKYLEGLMSGELVHSAIGTETVGQNNVPEWPTTIVRDGDEFIINAHKLYGTNQKWGDVCMLVAVDEDRNCWYVWVEGDTPGFTHDHVYKKLGMAGSGGGYADFKDCRVPVEMAIPSSVGADEQYFIFYAHCAAEALGCMEGIFERAVDFCKVRTSNFKPVAELQGVRYKLAALKMQIEACHSMVYDMATLYDEYKATGDQQALKAFMTKSLAAKIFVSKTGVEVSAECMRLHGGLGYHDPNIAHFVGDSLGYMIMDISDDIHYGNLANLILE